MSPSPLKSGGQSIDTNLPFSIPPFPLARTFSTLDHLTNGRVAWNVVTSWSTAAAKAFGRDLVAHDKRYEIAEEYMDVVYKYVFSLHIEGESGFCAQIDYCVDFGMALGPMTL